jgi:hypothetical protein
VARGIDQAHDAVTTGGGEDMEASLDGGEQRSAATVVGMLAEDLDPSGDPPRAGTRRIADPPCIRGGDDGELARRMLGGLAGEAERLDATRPVLHHGAHCAVASAAATAAMSSCRERSSTPARMVTACNRVPRPIASVTAVGSSSSPRGDGVTS